MLSANEIRCTMVEKNMKMYFQDGRGLQGATFCDGKCVEATLTCKNKLVYHKHLFSLSCCGMALQLPVVIENSFIIVQAWLNIQQYDGKNEQSIECMLNF